MDVAEITRDNPYYDVLPAKWYFLAPLTWLPTQISIASTSQWFIALRRH
jgi:hypothetical protein